MKIPGLAGLWGYVKMQKSGLISGRGRIMQDVGGYDCPLPEPFQTRIGMILFIAALFYLGFVTRMIFAPLLPLIEQEIDITHTQAGSLFLMVSIGYLTAPLSSGLLSSRINHRGTLILSAWIMGLAIIPFAFADNIWAIRLLMMMVGFASGIHIPSAIATITAEIRKEDWGKALSIHQSAPPLALCTAPLIATFLLQFMSWRIVLMSVSVTSITAAAIYSFLGRGGEFPGHPPSPANIGNVVGRKAFWIMVLLFAMAMGGNAGIFTMLPLYLVNERAMDLSTANTLVGLSQISGLIMVFVAGFLTDRIGQKPMMTAALTLAGICTVLLGLLDGWMLKLFIFIQPAVLTAFFPAGFGALSRIAPPYLRSVTSSVGPPTSYLIGGGLVPPLIGYLGQTYQFSTGFVLFGIFMLIGPLLTLFLKFGQYDEEPGC